MVLMKLLNEVHIPDTINEVQLEDFIGAILLKDQIAFSDEDFPIDGRSHNKVLYIAVKCWGKEVSRVLIDNCSTLDLRLLSTLYRLGISEELIKPSKVAVRSFDGMKKDVIGDIELEVNIGPMPFMVDFQVLDIPRTFNLLLGRSWIHMAGAIPSSLHQKVQFVFNGKMITVHG
ncbi:hypothetical protein NL676_002064 [Syzygium grande]|nr:hypothetical protein NL676_002064 [Syzygium grande]